MSRTAIDEARGGSVVAAPTTTYRLRLPYGPGGARYYLLSPTVSAINAILPDARLCEVGGIPTLTISNHGTQNIIVKTRDSVTTIGTIVPGQSSTLWCGDNSTAAGEWFGSSHTSSLGTALNGDRELFSLTLGSGTKSNYNLRREIELAYGYTGATAASVQCVIADDVVIGSASTSLPAFDTGTWPTGSTLVLAMSSGARICGRGGDGGRGGTSSLLAAAGGAGGVALVVRMNTNLFNYGYVQGGGGGGGGGANNASGGGGGGGGGAGHEPSVGGIGTPLITGNGGQGFVGVAGVGGDGLGQDGGNGGGPGAAGTTAGAAGGAAGDAIQTYTGFTLTKIVAGTINGAEVTV